MAKDCDHGYLAAGGTGTCPACDLETIHEAAARIDPSVDVLAEIMKRDRP